MNDNYVVVGIDQSDQSVAALRWAADYARTTGAGLRAFYIQPESIRAMPYSAGLAGVPLSDPVAWETASWTAAQQLFSAVTPEPSWTLTQIGHGQIGPELVAASRHAALLVVGKGEHTGFDRLVEGSVSHFCLSHAVVPVVGVPAAAALRDGAEQSSTETSVEAITTRPAQQRDREAELLR